MKGSEDASPLTGLRRGAMQNNFKSIMFGVREPEFVPPALIHTNCMIMRWLFDLSKAKLDSSPGYFGKLTGIPNVRSTSTQWLIDNKDKARNEAPDESEH